MNNKILIVDDDPNIREVISVLLSSEGYKVLTAENGQMALDIVNTEKMLDVVVLDIMMPDMDGIEVCRRIREKSLVPVLCYRKITRQRQSHRLYDRRRRFSG